ncbi:MAG: hypothetical protein J5958_00590 [Clostridia bacterium]|nr:hypothetical protein [Clostridia bacterium]
MKMTKDKLKGLLSISLFVQAICMIVVSLTQFKRRKGLAFSFLGIGAICAALAAAFGKFEYTDLDDEDEDEGEKEAVEATDDLDIDDDMLRADLAHGTDDED